MTTDDMTAGAQGAPAEMNDEVALLVRLAGTSGLIAAERRARVRAAVYGAWSDEYVGRGPAGAKTLRRRLTVAVSFAAAAALVTAVAIWGTARTPAPARAAQIDHVTGQDTASPGSFTTGGAVMPGSTVATSVGTLAMTLTSGVHLRLDASSTVRLVSANAIELERGAVYVDSAGAHPTQGGSPISIHTPAGVVRDIGTKFDVRLDGAGVRIRVRDGEVLVTDANGAGVRAVAGEELFSGPDTRNRPITRPIAATGSEWAWAERAAPPFSMEGQTLGAFLEWVSREGAWTVTFADSRLSDEARAIVLHGGPDLLKGMTPVEALDVVLPICGLRYHTERDRVVIDRETRTPGRDGRRQ